MRDFSNRLTRCADLGDFTVADVSRWFDRPYHTIWFWVHKGAQPRGSRGQLKRVEHRLQLLEKAIASKRGLPIPADLGQNERPDYIENLRDRMEN